MQKALLYQWCPSPKPHWCCHTLFPVFLPNSAQNERKIFLDKKASGSHIRFPITLSRNMLALQLLSIVLGILHIEVHLQQYFDIPRRNLNRSNHHKLTGSYYWSTHSPTLCFQSWEERRKLRKKQNPKALTRKRNKITSFCCCQEEAAKGLQLKNLEIRINITGCLASFTSKFYTCILLFLHEDTWVVSALLSWLHANAHNRIQLSCFHIHCK